MNRVLGAFVYNWPLKLAALALSSLLYVGLIFSQNAQSIDVGIRIDGVNPPLNTILIGTLGEVTNIRYFVANQSDVTITSANFSATVDLSQVQPGPQTQSVRVQVTSADPRIQVISQTPAFVSVHLERVEPKENVPVEIALSPIPDGLAVGKPAPSVTTARVRGASSDIARVSAVRANVQVDASGIDIDGDYPLTAIDELGQKVQGVEVEPATVHVTMAVFKDRGTATVPITPIVVGTPPPGFEVGEIEPAAPTVAIQGDAADLANVPEARTQPISVDGRTADFDVTVGFDLPQGVSALQPQTVRVHVTIRAVNQSRSFTAGIVLANPRPDRVYTLSILQSVVTIGGSPADLDRLNGATISLSANVADLAPGTHVVPLTITLQAGLTVVAISPASVTVTVAEATPSAAPAASGGG